MPTIEINNIDDIPNNLLLEYAGYAAGKADQYVSFCEKGTNTFYHVNIHSLILGWLKDHNHTVTSFGYVLKNYLNRFKDHVDDVEKAWEVSNKAKMEVLFGKPEENK